jgi:hypothetical protein
VADSDESTVVAVCQKEAVARAEARLAGRIGIPHIDAALALDDDPAD